LAGLKPAPAAGTVPVVAGHDVLAVTTVVLVFLTTSGVGN
jgi:hypothetical protein